MENTKKKTQTQWSNEYNAKAYDRVTILVKKGEKDVIKERAAALGLSVNAYIVGLIAEDLTEAGKE